MDLTSASLDETVVGCFEFQAHLDESDDALCQKSFDLFDFPEATKPHEVHVAKSSRKISKTVKSDKRLLLAEKDCSKELEIETATLCDGIVNLTSISKSITKDIEGFDRLLAGLFALLKLRNEQLHLKDQQILELSARQSIYIENSAGASIVLQTAENEILEKDAVIKELQSMAAESSIINDLRFSVTKLTADLDAAKRHADVMNDALTLSISSAGETVSDLREQLEIAYHCNGDLSSEVDQLTDDLAEQRLFSDAKDDEIRNLQDQVALHYRNADLYGEEVAYLRRIIDEQASRIAQLQSATQLLDVALHQAAVDCEDAKRQENKHAHITAFHSNVLQQLGALQAEQEDLLLARNQHICVLQENLQFAYEEIEAHRFECAVKHQELEEVEAKLLDKLIKLQRMCVSRELMQHANGVMREKIDRLQSERDLATHELADLKAQLEDLHKEQQHWLTHAGLVKEREEALKLETRATVWAANVVLEERDREIEFLQMQSQVKDDFIVQLKEQQLLILGENRVLHDQLQQVEAAVMDSLKQARSSTRALGQTSKAPRTIRGAGCGCGPREILASQQTTSPVQQGTASFVATFQSDLEKHSSALDVTAVNSSLFSALYRQPERLRHADSNLRFGTVIRHLAESEAEVPASTFSARNGVATRDGGVDVHHLQCMLREQAAVIAAKDQVISDIKLELSSVSRDIEALQQSIGRSRAEAAELQRIVEFDETVASSMELQLKDALAIQTRTEDLLFSTEDSLHVAQDQLSRAEDASAELRSQLCVMAVDQLKLSDKLRQAERQLAEAREMNDDCMSLLEQKEVMLLELHEQLDHTVDRKLQMESAFNLLQNELMALDDENAQLNEAVAQREEELEVKDGTIEKLRAKWQEARNGYFYLEQERDHLAKDLYAAQEAEFCVVMERMSTAEECSLLQSKVSELTASNVALAQSLHDRERSIQVLRDRIEVLEVTQEKEEEAVDEVNALLDDATFSKEQLQLQVEEKDAQIVRDEKLAHDLREQLQWKTTELDAALVQIIELNKRLQSLGLELEQRDEEYEVSYNQLHMDRDIRRKDVSKLQAQLMEKERQLLHSSNRIAQLESQLNEQIALQRIVSSSTAAGLTTKESSLRVEHYADSSEDEEEDLGSSSQEMKTVFTPEDRRRWPQGTRVDHACSSCMENCSPVYMPRRSPPRNPDIDTLATQHYQAMAASSTTVPLCSDDGFAYLRSIQKYIASKHSM